MHIIARPAEYFARLNAIEAARQNGLAFIVEVTAGPGRNKRSGSPGLKRDGTLMLFASPTARMFIRVDERGGIRHNDPEVIDT